MEYTFKLSVESLLEYASKLKNSGSLPPAALAAIMFVEQLKNKKLEITIRAVDEKGVG
jgi:carbamate kinase